MLLKASYIVLAINNIIGILFALSIIGDKSHVQPYQLVGLLVCATINVAVFSYWRFSERLAA